MLCLVDCFEARNGMRNTFCFVSFSKFGTYSVHTVWNRSRRGPSFFDSSTGTRQQGPPEGIISSWDLTRRKKCTSFHTFIRWKGWQTWPWEVHLLLTNAFYALQILFMNIYTLLALLITFFQWMPTLEKGF